MRTNLPLQMPSRRSTPAALTLILLTGAALLVGRPAVSALLRQATDTTAYLLQRTYKAAEIDHVKVVTNMIVDSPQAGAPSINATFNFLLKETTQSVKPDNTAILTQEFEQATAVIGDQKQDIMQYVQHALIQETRDPHGHILAAKVEKASGPFTNGNNAQMFDQLLAAFYPLRPLKIGESAKIEYTLSMEGIPPIRMAGNTTLAGIEMLGTRKTLKVQATADTLPEENAKVKLHFSGTANLDPTTGKVVSMHGTLTGDAGPLGKNKTEITYALQPPAAQTGTGTPAAK